MQVRLGKSVLSCALGVAVSCGSAAKSGDASALRSEAERTDVAVAGPTHDPETRRASTRLAGILRVPRDWGAAPESLLLTRVEPGRVEFGYATLSEVEPGTWHWDFGEHAAGRYVAYAKPYEWRVSFEHAPAAATAPVLAVPPPATVCVRLVDELTRESIHDEDLAWSSQAPPELVGFVPVIAPFDVAHDGYRFTAPVGNVVISFSDARHDLRTETIRVGPGKNEVELPFAAFVYARVFAVRDGRRVAWPESVLLHAWKDGTNHPYRRSRARGDAVELGFDEPGAYRIWLDNALWTERFHTPVSVDVELSRDRIVEIEMPLSFDD